MTPTDRITRDRNDETSPARFQLRPPRWPGYCLVGLLTLAISAAMIVGVSVEGADVEGDDGQLVPHCTEHVIRAHAAAMCDKTPGADDTTRELPQHSDAP